MSVNNYSGHCITENEPRVCYECIGNAYLKQYIKKHGSVDTCSYCKRKRTSLQMSSFLPVIMDGIAFSYCRAVDELPCDEGQYVGRQYTNYQLIFEELYDEIAANDEQILDDIVNAMEDETWCDIAPFMDKEEDDAYHTWTSFCKMIREQVRYVFFKAVSDDTNRENPTIILDMIDRYCQKVNLIRRIDKNIKLFRCRNHDTPTWLTSEKDFAPPPIECASSGRMNAAGISLLYLTLDVQTALCETDRPDRDYASVASYRLKDPMYVLDLSKISTMDIPSIFDIDNRQKRPAILFLKKFADSISTPRSNNDIGIDYVPTQIVTEFFRYVKPKDRHRYDGIMYNSTQNPGGKCLALFLTREEVLNKKFGIHIVPSQTSFFQKTHRYEQVTNGQTKKAIASLLIDGISKTKVTDIGDAIACSAEEIDKLLGI